ncbi:MAG: sulfur oxidation c-type cytochrome SoxX [Burkholderiales bacterium]|nr:sulfur oxidation c-type cytochrome SoxX [Burkholderiales bacterium]
MQNIYAYAAAGACLFLSACASVPSSAELDKLTAAIIKASFREALRASIEAANMKTIKWPSDGKFLGDWREGEKIAQSGRGLTWTDDATQANGGNCYNCHQIDQKEISYGTIGPSLHNYGKLRGITDPNSATAKPIVEYTWGKIWNAKAYNACSNMPRAGHAGILNEAQVRHVVGLLLDPKSPVNQ